MIKIFNSSACPYGIGGALIPPQESLQPDSLKDDPTFKALAGKGVLRVMKDGEPAGPSPVPVKVPSAANSAKPAPAAELISRLAEMDDPAAIREILNSDSRKSVMAAAEKRLHELEAPSTASQGS